MTSLNTSQQRISSTTSPTSTRSPGKEKIIRTAKRGENSNKNVQNLHESIRARFGYDSKPSSSKEHLQYNKNTGTKKLSNLRKTTRNTTESSETSSSSSSSSEDELAQGSRYKTSRVSRKSPAKPLSSVRPRKTTEQHKGKATDKVPYFIDPKREEERLRRKNFYKTPLSSIKLSYDHRRSRSSSGHRRRSRSRHRNYSNSPRSPKRRKNQSKQYSRRSRSHSRDRRRPKSYSRRRSRGRRSPSRSRSKDRSSRSRSKDRSSRSRSKDRSSRSRSKNSPEKQYIPIPVPMEYPMPPGAWMPPNLASYGRNPYMLRPPIRPPYYNGPRMYSPMPPPPMNPMAYLNRNMWFPGMARNLFRPWTKK